MPLWWIITSIWFKIVWVVDPFFSLNLLKSKGEVRRAIKDKGIKINDKPVDHDNYLISLEIFQDTGSIKLSHGKKNHVLIKLIS